jgi:hypothetical protein
VSTARVKNIDPRVIIVLGTLKDYFEYCGLHSPVQPF